MVYKTVIVSRRQRLFQRELTKLLILNMDIIDESTVVRLVHETYAIMNSSSRKSLDEY